MRIYISCSILVIFLLSASASFSQSTSPVALQDTAKYPYWIQMMQDPSSNFFATQKAFNTYWQDRKITKGCGWKPFKRWENYMHTRVSPNGDIPSPDYTLKTINAYYQQKDASLSLAGNWISQGPFDLPADKGYKGLGRVNTIAFHPTDQNTIYVGAPSGGCWVTTVGGNNWTTTTDMLPTLGVSGIAIDPLNPSTIYIGTGDRDAGDAPGMGVMKSTDNGQTWAFANTGMGNATVAKLLIHPTNPLVIYAATSTGIYKSIDGAANWERKTTIGFKDITFKPNSTTILYGASGGNFYRSTDSGENWYQITAGLPSASRGVIGVTPADPQMVYFLLTNSDNSYRGVYRSTDGGNIFAQRSVSPNIMDWSCDGSGTGGQAWYDLAIAVDPVNPNIIYSGGVDVWKSTDGGVFWQINAHWYGGCSVPAVHADQHFFAFNPLNNRLYIGNDGGIYWTDNGGSSWNEISSGLAISQPYKLGQSATIDDLVANGYQDNGTSLFDNGTWYAIGGGDGMECAIDFIDPTYRYTTVYYGSINRVHNLENQGTIAGKGVNGIDEDGAWVTPFLIDEQDPNSMFIGYKNVWRSDNIKASSAASVKWKKISNINTANLEVLEQSPVNTNILYASSAGSLYLSTNAKSEFPSWLNISGNLPAAGTITAIEAHPYEENTVYLTQANKVFKSTDRGSNWVNISGTLPNIHISTIVYYKHSQEGLYVGTDAGVFYRENGMNDWIPFTTGLPANARVTELEIYNDSISPAADRIKAATYGRGMWKSDMYVNTPVADFSADKLLIPVGCAVNFKDLSSGVPSEWNWSFPGASPSSSSAKNPSNITYTAAGVYNVQLISGNQVGSDTILKTGYIVVSDTLKPQVGFTANPKVLCNPFEIVALTDTSRYCPGSWEWLITPNTFNFVNGTSMNSQNPQVQFTSNGNYSVQLTVTNSNGNATVSKQDYLVVGGYLLPFSEDFESASFASKSWEIENPDNMITWDLATVSGNEPGNIAARMNFFDYSVPPGRRDRLITPALDFTGTDPVFMTFEHAYASRYTSFSDSLIILISEDCGISWERIFAAGEKGQGTFATVPKQTTLFIPSSADDWCGGGWGSSCYLLDLTHYANRPQIKIAFESYNRYGNDLYVDNINISRTTNLPLLSPGSLVHLFPNPSKGFVTLSSEQPVEKLSVKLQNLFGETVYNNSYPASSSLNESIDLTNLPKGIYVFRIAGEHIQQNLKIIID
ncbi:MAG: T9SS type A sorting domain-containing protein [Bacteroidetes bacterium]|nr:T9SS type A sorting domain-containing protein [Bacteroidota bacterium]